MNTAICALNDVAAAIHSACATDLPDMITSGTDFRGKKIPPRRPQIHHLMGVEMFQQCWGSTALGFGGIGAAAMTAANTVIITGPSDAKAVYFAGRLAFVILRPNRQFYEDVAARNMVPVSRAKSRYEEKAKLESEVEK